MIRVTLARLGLNEQPVPVALGGGLMQSNDPRLIGAIKAGVAHDAPSATVHVTSSPPIVGAALLGLDEVGAGDAAQARLRHEFHELLNSKDNPNGDPSTDPRSGLW